jgi:hypothetical protein
MDRREQSCLKSSQHLFSWVKEEAVELGVPVCVLVKDLLKKSKRDRRIEFSGMAPADYDDLLKGIVALVAAEAIKASQSIRR